MEKAYRLGRPIISSCHPPTRQIAKVQVIAHLLVNTNARCWPKAEAQVAFFSVSFGKIT